MYLLVVPVTMLISSLNGPCPTLVVAATRTLYGVLASRFDRVRCVEVVEKRSMKLLTRFTSTRL